MPVRSNIAAMSGYTPGEQPQAGKFIKLNTNENPYPPSAKVTQAIHAVLEQGLAKYPDPVANSFRRRAAEVLGVEPDWILCGNGSDDGGGQERRANQSASHRAAAGGRFAAS